MRECTRGIHESAYGHGLCGDAQHHFLHDDAIPDPQSECSIPALDDDPKFLEFVVELARDDQAVYLDPAPDSAVLATYGQVEHGAAAAGRPFDGHPFEVRVTASEWERCPGRPSTSDRKTRLREKNRKNQANYRARCREQLQQLRIDISSTRYHLAEVRERWRRLKHEKHALQHRLITLGKCSQSKAEVHHATDLHTEETKGVLASGNPDEGEEPASSLNGVQQCSMRGNAGSNSQPMHSSLVRRASRGPASAIEPEKGDDQEPPSINSFAFHAPISYELVSPYVLPRHLWASCRTDILLSAVKEYQHAVCAARRLPVSDVCWFFECPVEGRPLSFSAGLFSPECSAAASLSFAVISTECLFLVLEHELLRATIDPSFKPQMRSTLQSMEPIVPPSAPDPAVVAQIYIRAGVNLRIPLATAVQQVVRPTLRKYRALLSLATWKHVTLQSMRVLQASLDSIVASNPNLGSNPIAAKLRQEHRDRAAQREASVDAATPPSILRQHGAASVGGGSVQGASGESHCELLSAEESAGCAHPQSHEECSMPWELMDMAMVTMIQLMLCEMFAVLRERVPSSQVPQTRTLDQVYSRMHELTCSVGTLSQLVFHCAPLTSRRILLGTFISQQRDQIKNERFQSKLYKQLQLAPHQRAALRQRWHSWCRRRKALDHHISAALQRLHTAAPFEDLPRVQCLLQRACTVAASGPLAGLASLCDSYCALQSVRVACQGGSRPPCSVGNAAKSCEAAARSAAGATCCGSCDDWQQCDIDAGRPYSCAMSESCATACGSEGSHGASLMTASKPSFVVDPRWCPSTASACVAGADSAGDPWQVCEGGGVCVDPNGRQRAGVRMHPLQSAECADLLTGEAQTSSPEALVGRCTAAGYKGARHGCPEMDLRTEQGTMHGCAPVSLCMLVGSRPGGARVGVMKAQLYSAAEDLRGGGSCSSNDSRRVDDQCCGTACAAAVVDTLTARSRKSLLARQRAASYSQETFNENSISQQGSGSGCTGTRASSGERGSGAAGMHEHGGGLPVRGCKSASGKDNPPNHGALHNMNGCECKVCNLTSPKVRQGCGSTVMSGATPNPNQGQMRWDMCMSTDRESLDCSTCVCMPEVPALVGMVGKKTSEAWAALEDLVSVHRSDGSMHTEVCMPFIELDEVQHVQLMASQVEMGMTAPDIFQLFQTAMHDERREALFQDMRQWSL